MDPLPLIAAFLLGTLTVARVTRLIVADAYPPAEWVRDRFREGINRLAAGGRRAYWFRWLPLVECPFCAAPYVALANIAWAAAVIPGGEPWNAWGAAWWWWIANAWGAVSYAASMVVVRDEPPAE